MALNLATDRWRAWQTWPVRLRPDRQLRSPRVRNMRVVTVPRSGWLEIPIPIAAPWANRQRMAAVAS